MAYLNLAANQTPFRSVVDDMYTLHSTLVYESTMKGGIYLGNGCLQ